MDLPHLWRCTEGPAAHGMRAQLLLAFLLGALLLPFLLMIPRATHKVSIDFEQSPAKGARFHRLEIGPDGRMRVDGDLVGVFDLRARLERITLLGDDWVDFRPDPNLRYETFLEVLAITRRAHVERLRLDSSAFAGSIDEDARGYPYAPLPPEARFLPR